MRPQIIVEGNPVVVSPVNETRVKENFLLAA